MKIQAELSIYPLKEAYLAPYIDSLLNTIRRQGLTISTGTMSTIISGERDVVFQAIADGFACVADQCKLVLVVKYSNACPACLEEPGMIA